MYKIQWWTVVLFRADSDNKLKLKHLYRVSPETLSWDRLTPHSSDREKGEKQMLKGIKTIPSLQTARKQIFTNSYCAYPSIKKQTNKQKT